MARSTALFLTEGQISERIGLPLDALKTIIPALEKDGFPLTDPLFANRRYWPACQAYLDKRYGLASSSGQGNPALDGDEQW